MIPAGPQATRAVVVGIDAYRTADWALSQCVADAAGVALWLLDAEVPPDRVTCLFSSVDDGQAAAVTAVRERGATVLTDAGRDSVERVFRALHSEGDELLVVFWSGHGVLLDGDDDRALLTADASENWLTNVRVNEVLSFLTGGDTGPFPHQLLLFDACANYVEQVSPERSAPTSTWAHSRYRYEVNQFVLYSAAQGQTAAATRTRFAGFTPVVLEQLRGRGWPPDGPGLSDHVTAHFQRLRDKGLVRQTPVTFWRGGTGARQLIRFGGEPVAGRVQRASLAAGLTVAQVRRLAEALATSSVLTSGTGRERLIEQVATLLPGAAVSEVRRLAGGSPIDLIAGILLSAPAGGLLDPLFDALDRLAGTEDDRVAHRKARQLWQWQLRLAPVLQAIPEIGADQLRRAFGAVVPDRQLASSELDLDEILEYLAAFDATEPAWRHPLLIFVARLETVAGGTVPDDWFQLAAPELRLLRETAQAWAGRWTHLVINAMPGVLGNPPEFSMVSGHLARADGRWDRREVSCAHDPAAMEQAARELLDWAHEIEERDLTIGFLLPSADFDLIPEQWRYEDGFVGPEPIGTAYPVVLHCGERFVNTRPHRMWARRSREIQQQLAVSPAAVQPLPAALPPVPYLRQLIAMASCVVLHRAGARPARGRDAFADLVRWGAPYLIWSEGPGPDESVPGVLTRLVAARGFEELPISLYEESGGPALPAVRLVWDSPAWLPPMEEDQ